MSIKRSLKVFEKFATKQRVLIEDEDFPKEMNSQKYIEKLEKIKAEIRQIEEEIDNALIKLEK